MTVIDGAVNFEEQFADAPGRVKAYLRAQFRRLLADERFLDGLEGHLPPAAGPGRVARARSILERLVASK